MILDFCSSQRQVQPGNSGGPLVDESGNVVGVVTSKLSALWAANAISDVPQNVNFALKASLLADFLARNNVPFLESLSDTALRRSATDLADELGAAVVAVSCRGVVKVPPAIQHQPASTPPSVEPPPTTPPSPSEAVTAAKTICIYQRNGSPVVSNEISGIIVKWGKLSVVSRPQQADLVLDVTQTGELDLGTGAGNQTAASRSPSPMEISLRRNQRRRLGDQRLEQRMGRQINSERSGQVSRIAAQGKEVEQAIVDRFLEAGADFRR